MMEQEYGQVDNYHLLKEIGTGASCQVFVGFLDGNRDKKLAIKLINENSTFSREEDMRMMETECKILSKVKHKHIVNLHSVSNSGRLKIGNLEFKEPYTVLELAENGCIVDCLEKTGNLTEDVSRYYFRQLIEGLEHIHSHGYIHRDIKPDNLLLNSDFDMLISDFGHSVPMVDGVSDDTTYWTQLGTPMYNPPESHSKPATGSPAVDIFMAGTVLFIFLTGMIPFKKGAETDDLFYQHFYQGTPRRFWTAHFKNSRIQLPEDAIELMTSLFAVNPAKRPSISDIKNHAWYNSPVPSKENVQKDMNVRFQKIRKINHLPNR